MIQIAGGIVWNPKKGIAVVNQQRNSWSLPKGHVEAHETFLEAAVREIHEETGIPPESLVLIRPLDPYMRTRIKRSPDDAPEERTLTFFFFQTTTEELDPLDPENPEARWIQPEDVADILTHERDKEFFRSFMSQAVELHN